MENDTKTQITTALERAAHDQADAYREALNNIKATQNTMQQPCPHCGYCPHCGRGGHNTLPHYPQPYPWPMNPAPWPFTGACGGGGGIGQPNISGVWFNK